MTLIEELIKLSDEEFREKYLEILRANNKYVVGETECNRCGQQITSIKQLRILIRRRYHQECFGKVYEKERDNFSEPQQRYLDRVKDMELY